MPTDGRQASKWNKTLLCQEAKENSTTLGRKGEKRSQEANQGGVIERIPAKESALWISPAGFVAKDEKEEKLRLVCDLRQLNKGVKPDSSVFPTLNKIMQAISSAS